MNTLEERLRRIEDRLALQDLILAYCNNIDTSNVDGVVACFAADAELDLSGLGLPVYNGTEAIRTFFTGVFATMKHNAHYSTNFMVEALDGDTARGQAYVFAVGKAHDGSDVLVHARHCIAGVRTPAGWKIARFTEPFLMPPTRVIPDFDTAPS